VYVKGVWEGMVREISAELDLDNDAQSRMSILLVYEDVADIPANQEERERADRVCGTRRMHTCFDRTRDGSMLPHLHKHSSRTRMTHPLLSLSCWVRMLLCL